MAFIKADEQRLMIFERKMLGNIFGPVQDSKVENPENLRNAYTVKTS